MTEVVKMLKSRTVWTLVLIAVVGGVQAVQPFMSPELFVFVNSILAAVAAYFKLSPSQEY